MSQSLSYLIQRLKPYWLDAAAAVAGIELNKIIHFPPADGSVSPAEFYPKTEAGLIAALAATAAGSVVRIPSGNIALTAALTIPDDVTLYGQSNADTILSGDYPVMGSNSLLANLSISNTADDANPLYGVINANYVMPAVLYNCLIDVRQAGTGNAYGVSCHNAILSGYGRIYIEYCHIYGESGAGNGYAGRASAGLLFVWHSRCRGSKDRFTLT